MASSKLGTKPNQTAGGDNESDILQKHQGHPPQSLLILGPHCADCWSYYSALLLLWITRELVGVCGVGSSQKSLEDWYKDIGVGWGRRGEREAESRKRADCEWWNRILQPRKPDFKFSTLGSNYLSSRLPAFFKVITFLGQLVSCVSSWEKKHS